jgi:small conductance mechanosensitive channel
MTWCPNHMPISPPQTNISGTWSTVHRMAESLVSRTPNILLAVITLGLFYIASILARLSIERIARNRRRHNVSVVVGRLVAAAIMLVGLLVALTVVAPSFQANDLIKVLGIGSVAIGFAFQNILQNFLAGILLLWTEPFRIGDQIRLDPYEGTVEEIQTRATLIRTYDLRRVVIPNADLFTRSVIVNTAYPYRRWEYDLSAGSVDDIEGLKRAMVEAVKNVDGVLRDPPPQAFTIDVGDAGATIKIRIWWWTEPPRYRELLETHDRVLTAIGTKLRSLQRQRSDSTQAASSLHRVR